MTIDEEIMQIKEGMTRIEVTEIEEREGGTIDMTARIETMMGKVILVNGGMLNPSQNHTDHHKAMSPCFMALMPMMALKTSILSIITKSLSLRDCL